MKTLNGRRHATGTRKRVRFSMLPTVKQCLPLPQYGDCSEYDFCCLSDVDCVWWNSADLKYFKWRMIASAKKAIKQPFWQSTLVKIYNTNAKIPFYERSESKVFDVLQTIKVDPALVSLWCCEDERAKYSSRGLEKFSRLTTLRKNGKAGQNQFVSKSSHRYTQIVLSNQDKLSQEQLRQKCLQISRQDRVFARIIGAADAIVVSEQLPVLGKSQGSSTHQLLEKKQHKVATIRIPFVYSLQEGSTKDFVYQSKDAATTPPSPLIDHHRGQGTMGRTIQLQMNSKQA